MYYQCSFRSFRVRIIGLRGSRRCCYVRRIRLSIARVRLSIGIVVLLRVIRILLHDNSLRLRTRRRLVLLRIGIVMISSSSSVSNNSRVHSVGRPERVQQSRPPHRSESATLQHATRNITRAKPETRYEPVAAPQRERNLQHQSTRVAQQSVR